MWEVALTSIKLFLAGKLFQHPWSVFRRSVYGAAAAAALTVGLALAGLHVAAAAGVAGLVGGALQPWLFKDLKYR
jgi:tetrahydromethanopterin S-methyltransferase subunit D